MTREEVRAKTGVRSILEIAGDVIREKCSPHEREAVIAREDGTRLTVTLLWPDLQIPSVRPTLLVTEPTTDQATARARVWQLMRASSLPYAVLIMRPRAGGTLKECAEDILAAARYLSHNTAGRTVNVLAQGTTGDAAEAAFGAERYVFGTLVKEAVK